MSRLPEPGDCRRAMDAFDARCDAVGVEDGPEHVAFSMRVNTSTAEARTAEAGVMPSVYGDLFDVEEFLSSGGLGQAASAINDIAAGAADPMSAVVSLALQMVATGVLMERLRWERS